jgi:hypothetical protein
VVCDGGAEGPLSPKARHSWASLLIPIADIAEVAALGQFAVMTDARTFLINSLQRVIDGGDVTNDELDAAIADPARLRGAERKAWHGLSYWADDDDIRAKDPGYGPSRRRQLADLLADMECEKDS